MPLAAFIIGPFFQETILLMDGDDCLLSLVHEVRLMGGHHEYSAQAIIGRSPSYSVSIRCPQSVYRYEKKFEAKIISESLGVSQMGTSVRSFYSILARKKRPTNYISDSTLRVSTTCKLEIRSCDSEVQ